jgi:hypothetical protein
MCESLVFIHISMQGLRKTNRENSKTSSQT